MGGRLLRSWLERPLLNVAAINRRLNAVDALVKDAMGRDELIFALQGVGAMEAVHLPAVAWADKSAFPDGEGGLIYNGPAQQPIYVLQGIQFLGQLSQPPGGKGGELVL